jgi:hypothetical protein
MRPIVDTADRDTDLLMHLAPDGVFERFARFDKPGNDAESARHEGATTREEDAVGALDEDDDRRRDARVGGEIAPGATAAALSRNAFGGIPATTTVLMIAVPSDDLGRSTSDRVMGLRKHVIQLA